MKTAWVRVKGERDPWWQNVKRLLSGQGIRREPPEAVAVQQTAEAFADTLRAQSGSGMQIGLALSHEGQGRRRAVTVLAYSTDWAEAAPVAAVEPGKVLAGDWARGELPEGQAVRGQALRRVAQDTGLTG